MNTPSAKRIAQQGAIRSAEKAGGTGRNLLRFSSARAVEIGIPNFARLPVQPGAQPLQNADGSFRAIPGYNA